MLGGCAGRGGRGIVPTTFLILIKDKAMWESKTVSSKVNPQEKNQSLACDLLKTD